MKKSIIFILFLTLFSCGTRKVQIEKTKEEVKKDSVSQSSETENIIVKNDINSSVESEEVEISPKDTLKPMIINGISYINAVIRHKKSKTNTIDKTKKETLKNTLKRVEVKKEIKKQVFIKKVEKSCFPFYWLLFLLIIPLVWVYKKYKDRIWFV